MWSAEAALADDLFCERICSVGDLDTHLEVSTKEEEEGESIGEGVSEAKRLRTNLDSNGEDLICSTSSTHLEAKPRQHSRSR